MQKPWHMGTQLRELSKSYPMNTNMQGLSQDPSYLSFGQVVS